MAAETSPEPKGGASVAKAPTADGAGKGRGAGARNATPRVPLSKLFYYATPLDKFYLAVGLLCAVGQGLIFPLFTLVFANLLNAFNKPDFEEEVNRYSLYFLIIAASAAVAALLANLLPMVAAERQLARARVAYFKALLRQDVGFMDTSGAGGEVSSRLAEDTVLWAGGIGEKLSGALRDITSFIAGFAVGLSKSYKLTLVILAVAPFLALIVSFLAVGVRSAEKATADSYARAGDAATEAFSLIRSVVAYGGEEAEVKRYDAHLAKAEKAGQKKGWVMGAAVGGLFGMLFVTYGVAMYAGARFVIDSREANIICRFNPLASGCFSGGDVIATFMSVLIGAFALGGAGPNFAALGSAQSAAYTLFKVIERAPPVDSEAAGGVKPGSIKGKIEFRNVTFSYPSRPDEVILRNFSLTIQPGTMVALVGESGSGKSTLIQLLERFYDPQEGEIFIDDIPLKDYNVAHLRDMLGLVSQDPILFGVSVRENISYGKSAGQTATLEEIVEAAKAANAHAFISNLPNGYDTVVGTSVASAQLSGGQRQRICIARAIVRNPAILALDEATSALDTASERIVQASIDNLLEQSKHGSSDGRTSLVIAHRLSTITNADRIVVMKKGTIVEDGAHAELMAKEGGLYKHLRSLQDMGDKKQKKGGKKEAGAGAMSSEEEEVQEGAMPAAAEATPVSEDGATPAPGATAKVSPAATGEGQQTVVHVNPMHPQATHATKSSSKSSATATSSSGKKTAAGEEAEGTSEPKKKAEYGRVWRMQLADWPYLILAFIGSIVSGCIQPVFAIIYSNMITVFFLPSDQEILDRSLTYIGYFLAIAAAMFISTTARIGSFVYVGEKLTRRLRTMTYRALLRQPLAFFDDPANSTGRLNTRLSADAALIRGGTGEAVGMAFQMYSAVLAAAVIAFVANWKLALVMMALMPVLVAGHHLQTGAFKGYSMGASKSLEESGHIATESMMAFRTVTSLNLQGRMTEAFARTLDAPLRAGYGKARSAGFGQSFSAFVQFAAFALAFYVGAMFIKDGSLDFGGLMRVFLAVTMASQAVGSATTWGPDTAKAAAATEAIFAIIDRPSPIDALSEAGTVPTEPAQGKIEFRHVSFAYPGRPDVKVLRDFNLTVQAGQTVALVGESGSGKSTVVQLLERFYDPIEGEILVDGKPLSGLQVAWARAHMGLVQQEPALFADSIAYNIAYGVPGKDKMAPETGVPTDAAPDTVFPLVEVTPSNPAISQAAKDANAHDFVAGFKHGYATHVGSRGNQLSGGQKQRIAIARAIVRDPQILLLDEATSALDSQSEAVVQAALDRLLEEGKAKAAQGGDGGKTNRTTLVIAHRLSTVRHADAIVVVSAGRVIEQGTHDELMAIEGGMYRKLAMAQAEEPPLLPAGVPAAVDGSLSSSAAVLPA